jgi:hypothetical protein
MEPTLFLITQCLKSLCHNSSFIVLMTAICSDDLLTSVKETLGSLLDELWSNIIVPHTSYLLHQLSSCLRHRMTENLVLKKKYGIIMVIYCYRSRLTFMQPQMQKSNGAKSGEFGHHSVPPQACEPRARVLVPKLDRR